MAQPSIDVDPSTTIAALRAELRELSRRVAVLESAPGHRALRIAGTPWWSREHLEIETRLGLTWFNRVGAVIVVIGLGLFAVWANDRGYLTPLWRNLLGGVAALIAFGFGARALRSPASGRRGFGIGVTMVGAFGLYLVPVTASRVDTLVPPAVAVAFMVGLTIALAALAYRCHLAPPNPESSEPFSPRDKGEQVFAVLGLGGGLLLPLQAAPGDPGGGLLFAYLGLLWVGFVWLQRRLRAEPSPTRAPEPSEAERWLALDRIASTGVLLYYAGWLIARGDDGDLLALVVGSLVWAVQLGYQRLHQRCGRDGDPMVLLATAVVGGAGILSAAEMPAGIRIAALLGLLGSLVYLWRDGGRSRPLFELLAAAGLAGLAVAHGEVSGLSAPGPGGVLLGGLFLPFLGLYVGRAATGTRLGDEDHALAITATVGFTLVWIATAVTAHDLSVAALPLAVLALSWLATAVFLSREGRGCPAVSWCYNLSGLLAAGAGVLAATATGMSSPSLSLLATVLFTGCGLLLVAAGVGGSHSASRVVGLGLLAATLIKLLVVDVWTLAAGARIGVLLAIGVGLLASSFLYGRFTDLGRRR